MAQKRRRAGPFERALAWVLTWEGGYVERDDDPGGPTKWGITQATYDAYRRKKGLYVRPVRYMTDEECRTIYRTEYWERARCDGLAWPLSVAVFDAAVQHGVGTALRMLRNVQALTQGDAQTQALALIEHRRAFYHQLATHRPQLARFLRGWLARMDSLEALVRQTDPVE